MRAHTHTHTNLQIPFCKLHVLCKKVSTYLKKKKKSGTEIAEVPQKRISKLILDFEYIFALDRKKIMFFKKLRLFTRRSVLTFCFFEIHNPDEK